MIDKSSIFRKVSLERVSSPEQLNGYIKVLHPRVWLILGAVAALLVGVLVWGAFGTLTTTRDAVAVVADGNTICYVRPGETTGLAAGMSVHIADSTGAVTAIATTPIAISADFDAYALYLGGFQAGDFAVAVTVDIAVADGVYPAKMILERIPPIAFILN